MRLMIMSLLCLTACAGPKITAEDVEIARVQAEATRACYAAQQLPAYADARDAVIVALAQALTPDRCKQTNVYDARSAIAAGQNQAAARIVGNVANAGIAATGIVAGASTLKAAVKGAGSVITGDNNSTYDTRSDVHNRQGDNATLQAPTSGPDQSTTTTTTTTTTPEAPAEATE